MSDTISRRVAIDGLDGHRVERRSLNDWQVGWNDALEWVQESYLEGLPSAQPDNRLEKIADIVEGTIDHLDRDDAMDMLYQIKEVLK